MALVAGMRMSVPLGERLHRELQCPTARCGATIWERTRLIPIAAPQRDELLIGEILSTLKEAQVLIESWRRHYNVARPHSSLGYRPAAPETVVLPSWPPGSATLCRPPGLASKPAIH